MRNRAFSTIEILVAMAIVTSSLVGAVHTSLYVHTMLVDSELSFVAILRLDTLVRGISQRAFEGFNTIISTSTVHTMSEVESYTEIQSVVDITSCVKKVTFRNEWEREGVSQYVEAPTTITYPLYTKRVRENCYGTEFFTDDWSEYAAIESEINVNSLEILGEQATRIDVFGSVAVISFDSATSSDIDIVLFDTHTKSVRSVLDVGQGVLDVDGVFGDSSFLFVAQRSTSSQFMVIDISDIEAPQIVAQRSLLGVDPQGSFPEARTIFYVDNTVYVGTKETAGPELHVFNVESPYNPYESGFVEITHNINEIVVRDNIAYLATSSDKEELIIVNVSDPSAMYEMATFNAGPTSVNDKDATSLYLLGNTLYMGRKKGNSSNPELYMIDVASSTLPTFISSLHIPITGTLSYISSIVVQGHVGFVSTTDQHNGLFLLNLEDQKSPSVLSENVFDRALAGVDIEHDTVFSVEMLSGEDVSVFEIVSLP